MAPKRRSQPSSDAAGPSRPPKSRKLKPRCSKNPVEKAMTRKQNHELHNKFEELQAKVNQLEAKLYTRENPRELQNPIGANQNRSEPVDHGRYELRIEGTMKKRIYTGSEVQGQNGEPLKVALFYNGAKITSGPLASAKFEIVSANFEGSLLKPRKEVGSILTNPYISKFANGEALLDDLIFKDNSSWVEEKQLRLVIRVLGNYGVKDLEAITEPFRVLDRHGKASEKLHPPPLDMGVDLLEKVGNKGASDLKAKGIYNVKDFLQLYHTNKTSLLEILEIKSELYKNWKDMIKHAKECYAGPNLYSYQKDNTVIFFNSVYEFVGAEIGNGYRAFDELQDSEKILVNEMKKDFYKNIDNCVGDFHFKMVNERPVPIESGETSNQVVEHDDSFARPNSIPNQDNNSQRENLESNTTHCTCSSPGTVAASAQRTTKHNVTRAMSILKGGVATVMLLQRVRRERLEIYTFLMQLDENMEFLPFPDLPELSD